MSNQMALYQFQMQKNHSQELQIFKENIDQKIRAKSSFSSRVDVNNLLGSEQLSQGYNFELLHNVNSNIGAKYQGYQQNQVHNEGYSKKLQGAYILQNALSKMAAGLFISCWESLKLLMSHQQLLYHRLNQELIQNQQVDHSQMQVKIDQHHQIQKKQDQYKVKVLPQTQKNLQQMKLEIQLRQIKGFNLDTLGKLKQKRSKPKQIKKILEPEKDSLKIENKIIQNGKTLQRTKFTHMNPTQERFANKELINYLLNPFSVPFSYKSQIHSHQNNFIQKEHNVNQNRIFYMQEQHNVYQNQVQELQRVKVLAQIAEKLQFSKLRMQKRQNKTGYDFDIIRRILRIERVLMDLMKQRNNQQKNQTKKANYSQQYIPQNHQLSLDRIQQTSTLKRILHEIESIRSEVSEIRSLSHTKRVQSSYQPYQFSQNNFILGQYTNLNDTIKTYLHQVNKLESGSPLIRIQQEQKPSRNTEQKIQQKTSQKVEQKVDNNLSLSNKIYRKVHTENKDFILQLQEKQIREQHVRLMVENVKKRRLQQSMLSKSELQLHQPIRGHLQSQWKRLYEQREHLREQQDNCCVLMENY